MNKYLSMYRGDTAVFSMRTKRGRVIEPLTGASLFFTIKENENDLDTNALVRKIVGSGITITDALLGKALLTIRPLDTSTINPGSYYWDAQIVTLAGEVYTMNQGTFEIKADITRGSG